MARISSEIDWEALKPNILRLLSEGRARKDVIEEISLDGANITKSQLEYQLKCWGRRTNLTEQAWRYANHKVQKRARNRKDSAVFFNGALIPHSKVVKETRRHDRPTLLPAPGASPKCPEGFDLLICTPTSSADSPLHESFREVQHSLLSTNRTTSSLPWLKFALELRKNFQLTLAPFPFSLTDPITIKTPPIGVGKVDKRYFPLSEWSESNQTVDRDTFSRRRTPLDPQIVTEFGHLIFHISNKLSRGHRGDDQRLLANLANRLKIVAKSSSSWKDLIIADRGSTSRSLIEQLFEYSVSANDKALAEMMLQAGADPNQQIRLEGLGICTSALSVAVRWHFYDVADLLLNSGAIYGQNTLKHAIIARNFNAADRMLQSDSSLDLNFKYPTDSDPLIPLSLGPLKLVTVTLLGLMAFHCPDGVPTGIDKLEYLIGQGATITPETMILASFSAHASMLQFLMQHGGDVRGINRFGFSCLAAASLRKVLQYDVFDLLLRSGATTEIPRAHHTFGSQASPLHWLCLRQPGNDKFERYQLFRILNLLIESGANINYRVRHPGLPSQLAEAYERYLWSQSSQSTTVMDHIAQAKAESPLEYAIIAGNQDIALELVSRGCQLTGREITLAVKIGLISLLKALLKHGWGETDHENFRKTCLRLALRWGHEMIVRFLLGEGVNLGEQEMIDALQYPGISLLSTDTQIDLISATPDLEYRKIFGLPLLELCFLKFSRTAVREILNLFPAAYDSGALSAIVLRKLKYNFLDKDPFRITDIMTMISRRTKTNCDWEKENTALLVTAMFSSLETLRLLVVPGTACGMKTARLPKRDFSWILDAHRKINPYYYVDPTYSLGCQDWVMCSPLVGIAMTPCCSVNWSILENMLDHLLACSYEPDALTVVVAATTRNLCCLYRLECLENWRSIVSIDNHDRPSWCPTALQVAVSDGNEELVEFFLGADVSVNEEPASEPIGDIMPRTALQAAADKGNLRLTNLLIERGACINAPAAEDSGATALQLACIHGYLEISIRLLDRGADVNARGAQKNGRTALEAAAEHGRIDTIQLLLNHGAYTDGPHRAQYIKAIVHAEWNRHFAAAALLKEHREWTAEDEECYKSLQSYEWCDSKREW